MGFQAPQSRGFSFLSSRIVEQVNRERKAPNDLRHQPIHLHRLQQRWQL
jgi:hypothetical protein